MLFIFTILQLIWLSDGMPTQMDSYLILMIST